jgi:U3 small nucleolar RNA-associated protein 12
VSHHGNFVVTGSQDKSIRVYEKLDEPVSIFIIYLRTSFVHKRQLFLEEERERELEQLYEADVAETMNREDVAMSGDVEEVLGQTQNAEVTAVSKQTTETLMGGERIMEALELADNEREKFREYDEAIAKLSEDDPMRMQPPPKNPVLAAYNLEPEEHVLRVIEKVPSTALHDALLVLPFGKVVSLMHYLNVWVQKVRASIPLREE